MTLPQKNSPRIKTPYPYLMNLVSNYLEKNILSNTVKNQWHSIKNVVEITDHNGCILFGPPCIDAFKYFFPNGEAFLLIYIHVYYTKICFAKYSVFCVLTFLKVMLI